MGYFDGEKTWQATPDFDPSKLKVVKEEVYESPGEFQVRIAKGDQEGKGTQPYLKSPAIYEDPGGHQYTGSMGDPKKGEQPYFRTVGFTDGASHTFMPNKDGQWGATTKQEESGGAVKGLISSVLGDKKLMGFLAVAGMGAGAAAYTGSTAMAGLGTEGAVGTFGATGAGSGAVGWTGAAGAAEGAAGVGANSGWSAAMDTAPGATSPGVVDSAAAANEMMGAEAYAAQAGNVAADTASSGLIDAAGSVNSLASDAAANYSDAAQAGYDGVAQQAATTVPSQPVATVQAGTQAAGGGAATTTATQAGGSTAAQTGGYTTNSTGLANSEVMNIPVQNGSSYMSKVMDFAGSKLGSQILTSAVSGIGSSLSEYYKGDKVSGEKQKDREWDAAEKQRVREWDNRNMNIQNMPKINWELKRVEADKSIGGVAPGAYVKSLGPIETTKKASGIITKG